MEQKILNFINQIAEEKGIIVNMDTDLFANNVLDSMEIILLLTYMQDELNIDFAPEDLQFDNFQSVTSIINWINKELK